MNKSCLLLRFKKCMMLTFIFLFVCLSTVCVTNADVAVRILGAHLTFSIPQGIEYSRRFNVLIDDSAKSFIVVKQFDLAFDYLVRQYSTGELEKIDHEMVTKEEMTIQEHKAIMYTFIHEQDSDVFRKINLLVDLGNYKSAIITGIVPEHAPSQTLDRIKNIMMSVRWDLQTQYPFDEDIRFEVEDNLALKRSMVWEGRTKFYPVDDRELLKGGLISFDIFQVFSLYPINNIEEFTMKSLAAATGVDDLQIQQKEQLVIDDLPAVELIARGKLPIKQMILSEGNMDIRNQQKDLEKEVNVYSLIIFDGQSYYMSMGVVDEQNYDTYFGEFRKIARSFKLKDFVKK